ncbi:MAG: UDP-glucose/GDP-mannose dehydrogenase family protein [Candidatus Thermoplasmatota archaeon]|nr:UDP-glucose/GDP-mannose dehydrogenase family protein [Candidatus Thermoplasmatota archaeon]
MRISVIGTGYVGLTTGIALAELGNQVVLVDVIKNKLDTIMDGKAPFYEPGVDEMLSKHIERGNITTTIDGGKAVKGTDVTFITVGTPPREDGSMDDTHIRSASRMIGEALKDRPGFHVVVMKSTVVPGTTLGPIKETIEVHSGKKAGIDIGIAMCPEFLREGAAMQDSLHPDRVVVGCIDDRTYGILESLFSPLGSRILRTSPTSAEMIKYASNSFLATKISFANEVSRICEKLGIDVYEIMEGVGMDFRINPDFLRAGAGFGGSCFPKDVSALISIAKGLGIETPILEGAMMNNEIQPRHLVDMGERIAGPLKGRKVAVLGLSFKPDTDDVRETRSLPVINELRERGALITAHDPKATENFRPLSPEISYTGSPEEAVDRSEIVFLMTEWPEYRTLDWSSKSHLLAVIDGRRTLDVSSMKRIKYWAIGRPLPE